MPAKRRARQMMVDSYMGYMRTRDIAAPIEPPSLRTGVGHGHPRKSSRERPEKDAQAKKRRKSKMRKASRKRNRKG